MNIIFLGTGAAEGLPAAFCSCASCAYAREHRERDIRRRASILIDDALLIDLTPDFFSQALLLGRDLGALRAVLFTHAHKEHCYPWELRNLRPPYAVREADVPLSVCGSAFTLDKVSALLGEEEERQLAAFLKKHPLDAFTPVPVGDYTITALAARHSEGSFCYLVQKDGKSALFANDTGYFPEETWDYLDGIKLSLVCLDCSNLFEVETPNHMNIEDNVTAQRRLYQLGCADVHTKFYATHISHGGLLNHQQLDEHMRLYGIRTAYDGLTISL